MDITQQSLDQILSSVGEQLTRLTAGHLEIVVIGESALLALGFISRPTRDVEVLALAQERELRTAKPLPPLLQEASDRVGRDFELGEDWLNPGPTDLLRWGLPEGFWERLVTRHYGPSLTVLFASRLDQIHFKMYAMADSGGGRHEADLRALEPTRDELIAAARWTRTHDPSEAFRSMLLEALRVLGVEDVDLGA